MRENRTYGSEGGAAELNRPLLPLSPEAEVDKPPGPLYHKRRPSSLRK